MHKPAAHSLLKKQKQQKNVWSPRKLKGLKSSKVRALQCRGHIAKECQRLLGKPWREDASSKMLCGGIAYITVCSEGSDQCMM